MNNPIKPVILHEGPAPTQQQFDGLRCVDPAVPGTERTVITYWVALTEADQEIVHRFPVGLPVEVTVSENGDTRNGVVIGHQLMNGRTLMIAVDIGGSHPCYMPSQLRAIHGDERNHYPGHPPTDRIDRTIFMFYAVIAVALIIALLKHFL